MASVFVSPVAVTRSSRASTDRLVRLTVTFSRGGPPPRPPPRSPRLGGTSSRVASLIPAIASPLLLYAEFGWSRALALRRDPLPAVTVRSCGSTGFGSWRRDLGTHQGTPKDLYEYGLWS